MLFYKGFDCNDKKRWIPIPRFHEDRFHGNDREDLVLPPRRGRKRKVIYHYHKQKNWGASVEHQPLLNILVFLIIEPNFDQFIALVVELPEVRCVFIIRVLF